MLIFGGGGGDIGGGENDAAAKDAAASSSGSSPRLAANVELAARLSSAASRGAAVVAGRLGGRLRYEFARAADDARLPAPPALLLFEAASRLRSSSGLLPLLLLPRRGARRRRTRVARREDVARGAQGRRARPVGGLGRRGRVRAAVARRRCCFAVAASFSLFLLLGSQHRGGRGCPLGLGSRRRHPRVALGTRDAPGVGAGAAQREAAVAGRACALADERGRRRGEAAMGGGRGEGGQGLCFQRARRGRQQ